MLWLLPLSAAWAAPPCLPVSGLGWLTGTWVSQREAGRFEEVWSPLAGQTLIGHGRTVRGDATPSFEHLLIRPDSAGCAEYLAWPDGRPPTAFRLVQSTASTATFEAPTHDWPQRIAYVRAGDALTATVSDLEGDKTLVLQFQRAEAPAAP